MKLLGDAIAAEINSALSMVGTPCSLPPLRVGWVGEISKCSSLHTLLPTESSLPLCSYRMHTGRPREPCGGTEGSFVNGAHWRGQH